MAARICQITKVDVIPESLVRVYVNHSHARLSTDFYAERARKDIILFNHFLSKFSTAFKRHPEYAKFHYYKLARSYMDLGDKKNARKYLKKYFTLSPFFNPGISRRDIIETIWKVIRM